MQQPRTQSDSKPRKATLGLVLSIMGALLILLRGLVRIVVGDVITFAGSDLVRHRFLAGIALNIIGGIAVVFGILMIVGGYLMYIGMTTSGAAIVIIFSVLSVFVGTGWIFGFILGLIGGVLGLMKK